MDDDSITSHLVERSGIPDRVVLRRALTVKLLAIRDLLDKPFALLVAAHLPEQLAVVLRGPSLRPPDLAEIVERVHTQTGLRRDAALETIQSCLGFLGSLVPDDVRRDLIARLPADLAASIDRHEPRHVEDDSRVVVAHRQSIAASDDPHHDTRLSSAADLRGTKLSAARPGAVGRGLAEAGAAERSLAQGRPGAGGRSLADAQSPSPPDERARRRS
jgi:uncharacterized protein (DUF2267 family)